MYRLLNGEMFSLIVFTFIICGFELNNHCDSLGSNFQMYFCVVGSLLFSQVLDKDAYNDVIRLEKSF